MRNAFSVSEILRIPQTNHHKLASVPQQDMPEFPNLLYSNATRNCSELLTAPKSNTHAAVSVAEKCNIGVNMCLWVSLLVHCSTFSWPTHETTLQSICFLLLLCIIVSYNRGQCTGDLFLNSSSWTNRRKHYELRYKTNSHFCVLLQNWTRRNSTHCVLWVMRLCRLVVRYWNFAETKCFYLQGRFLPSPVLGQIQGCKFDHSPVSSV